MTDGKFKNITFDLGAFRYAAAAYVKFLIRARWKSEPGFLSEEALGRWKLSNIRDDPHSASQLLLRAGAHLAELNTNYISRCGSGGVAEYDLSTPEGRLMDNIAFLAECHGGGPFHNHELISAALQLPEGNVFAWHSLVDWAKLPEIRNDLDKLPEPDSIPKARKDDGVSANIFRHAAKNWNVRFQGGTLFAVEGGAGAAYLHRLLSRPDEKIDVHELSLVWDRFQATNARRAEQEEGLSINSTINDPIVDKEALAKCKKEFDFIQAERIKAKEDNDSSALDRLMEDERALTQQMSEWYTLTGKLKSLDDRNKRTYDRVYGAIKRIIEKVRVNDPTLGQHLEQCVHISWKCVYSPQSKVTWSL